MFEIYLYNDLVTAPVKKQFAKTIDQLSKGDFASAEVKKMHETNLYRAKLDYENRLIFSYGKYGDTRCLLILEVILNHEYEKSRFLRGAVIDENKLSLLSSPQQLDEKEHTPLAYLNSKHRHFHLLDKVISFDDTQDQILNNALPQIIIGSAGSGKTALTLERLKLLKGKVLYVTLSAFLAENSALLFYSHHFENDKLEVDFLSFREFIETMHIPEGKELDFKAFEAWFSRFRQAVKIKDAHQLFEEFRGVLTGMDTGKEFLSRADYLGLGVRQSIFLGSERESVYDVFEKYQDFLKEGSFYDLNQVAFNWLQKVEPIYDFIVIDEVQDLTNIQLYLLLQSLRSPNNFILCGDSNQVVHPNFFSWSNIKSLFYKQETKGNEISVLHSNYRNSPQVSELANLLLKIKNARFGSIDRESNYLVNTVSQHIGEAKLIEKKDSVLADLNKKTARSTQFAVLVMRNEDKAEAQRIFKTPLLFSVQESKGLEYDNIILYNLIGDNAKEFMNITDGVEAEDLQVDELTYARAKDKTDKSLDVYKFYINSLYVAITRAVKNVYMVEPASKHRLLELLQLSHSAQSKAFAEAVSSDDDWKREAVRLEKQGKTEQADAIRKNILHYQVPNWEVITPDKLEALEADALNPDVFNKKAKDRLFEYSLIYNQPYFIEKLKENGYKRANDTKAEHQALFRRYYQAYRDDNTRSVVENINRYGINYRDQFNLTPLHLAAFAGSPKISNLLLDNGANPNEWDSLNRNPLQVALLQSFEHQEYQQKKLGQVYHSLAPESIKIKANGRLIKLDKHQGEYFLLTYMLATQNTVIQKILLSICADLPGFKASALATYIKDMPEVVTPAFRKKQTYISSLLSKHETNGKDKYCKQLFKREWHGVYVLNPEIEILHNDEWVPVSEVTHANNLDEGKLMLLGHDIQRKHHEEQHRRIMESIRKNQSRNYY